MKPLRIAALVKQVPRFEEMQLGPDGRLKREGIELFMNPYCLRAVSKGVELAHKTGGSCTVISLGPPAAEDVVRWGVAGGADRGILISDPVFAGSDTLATARALAAALTKEGPFDLILVGKNSVDADTGQVGPGLRSRSPCQRFWPRPSVCAHQSEQNQKNARQWPRRSWPGCAPQTSVPGHGGRLAVRPGSVRPNCWRSTGHARCCRAHSQNKLCRPSR